MGIGGQMMRRAVFLDRDGVLNKAIVRNGKPHPPSSVGAVELLQGVEEATESLKSAGFELVVVTNQPDVARGTTSRDTVEAINAILAKALGIEHFRICYHDDADECACRKPKPGLLLDASRDLNLDLTRSYLVGDRWRDIEAGRAAGVKTIWLDQGYNEQSPKSFDHRASSLLDAVPWIVGQSPA